MPLKPISTEHQGKEIVLECVHKAIWPPVHTLVGDIEALRKSKVINAHKYEQLKTWQRVCGLDTMVESKCMTCPHARMQTHTGLQKVPHRDKPEKPLPPFIKAKRTRK